MTNKIIGALLVFLCTLELVLILTSWFMSAIEVEGIRSLLSAEGVRWFLGSFVDGLQNEELIWGLLLSIAWGCVKNSGVYQHHHDIRHDGAFRIVLFIDVLYILFILYLSIPSHAILRSATGELWPSAFSRAIVPMLAFILSLSCVIYGLITKKFTSVASVVEAMGDGVKTIAPYMVLYVFAMQLINSFRYVIS
ncbi:AbgT family transporter [Prevotella sp. E13-17]|uniref:AbgT family transporter n=1 Tax=Prevotella sp. E13-17 TaxID=2913616 RepID=UPI001EDB43B7|nr:AbgT family transporter [Prevotella sp. E13-17]UKK49837.1 AbgT family transporter [Prevotella sp. E13-17]